MSEKCLLLGERGFVFLRSFKLGLSTQNLFFRPLPEMFPHYSAQILLAGRNVVTGADGKRCDLSESRGFPTPNLIQIMSYLFQETLLPH